MWLLYSIRMSYSGENINTEQLSDINDVKFSELNYSNPATASYIIDSISSTVHPRGGNIYIYIQCY